MLTHQPRLETQDQHRRYQPNSQSHHKETETQAAAVEKQQHGRSAKGVEPTHEYDSVASSSRPRPSSAENYQPETDHEDPHQVIIEPEFAKRQ